MRPAIGRYLQLIGLAVLPCALVLGLAKGLLQLEVRMMFIGGGIFFVGWLLARKVES